ncbi:CHAT domain-containing protein [Micromonospora oryzae]|uniref:CHAT domain-containing protein n=1 Tax=Micromonospora sp. DSM 102119 TaxID=3111768 RepID=UPI0031DB4C74
MSTPVTRASDDAAQRYAATGERSELDESSRRYGVAGDASAALDDLHRALSALRDTGRGPLTADALDAAAHQLNRALGRGPAQLPDGWLDAVATAYLRRYEHSGDDRDLLGVAGCLRRRSAPPAEPALRHAAASAWLRSWEGRAPPGRRHGAGIRRTAELVVQELDAVLRATPVDHPRGGARAIDAGAAHLAHYALTADRWDPDRATGPLWRGMHSPGDLHLVEVRRAADAVSTLSSHVQRDRAGALTGALVGFLRQQTEARSPQDAAVVRALLARALVLHHEHAGDPALLDAAVHAADQALSSGQLGGDLGWLLETRAGCAAIRGRQHGDPADITAAVAFVERALAVASGPDERGLRMQMAGVLHQELFVLTGDEADLARALDWIDQAIDQATPGSSERTHRRLMRAGVLAHRFRVYRRTADIDEAIGLYLGGHSAEHVGGLGSALHDRFVATGDLADLDEAVAALREAARREQDVRTVLGLALADRFSVTGDSGDLAEAVGLFRAAHTRIDVPHPGGDQCRHLAGALLTAFGRTRSDDDLRQALACARAVTAAADPAARAGAHGALLLARTLGAAAAVWDRPADLTEARTLLLGLLGQDDLPDDVRGTALLLQAEFEAGQHRTVPMDIAVTMRLAELTRSARGLLRTTSVDWVEATLRLGSHLGDIGLRSADPAAQTEAARLFGEVVGHAAARPAHRREAAMSAGRLALRANPPDLARSLANYRLAVDLTADVAHGLADPDRQLLAGSVASLPTEAASAALEAGDAALALELSERARFLSWGAALRRRHALAELARIDPDLASRIEAMTRQLDRLARVRPAAEPRRWWERPDDVVEPASELRSRVRRVLAELLDQARALLGRDLFGGPATLAELRQSVGAGAAVLVNVSLQRCDALLVDAAGLRAVPLPRLTLHAAASMAQQYIQAVQQYAEALSGPAGNSRMPMWRAQEAMSEVLAWLWETTAEPVLTALGHSSASEGEPPRVWWCLTGPLTMLPIHAAQRGHGSPDAVLERVVSSYTLTLTHLSLSAGRTPTRAGVTDERPCVITIAQPPGLPPLVGPERQARRLDELLDPVPVRLDGREVTRDRLLQALGSHRIVHIAGHGHQDVSEPLRGGVAASDGAMTFQDVAAHPVGADLVFLDACHTAIGGTDVLNEGIHVASALQLAGGRHVIATLWQVVDHDLVTLPGEEEFVTAVYRDLAPEGTVLVDRAPYALHQALRRWRRERPSDVGAWAPYLHYGR